MRCDRLLLIFATLLLFVLAAAQSFGAASEHFTYPTSYNVGTNGANAVVAADVNQDGFVDMVVATNSGISVLLNNGDGTFSQSGVYDTGGTLSASLAVADVNNDGILDVVATNMCISSSGCSGVAVLLGVGDGTFLPPVGYDSGGLETGAVAVGDFNGDGWPDLALTSNCQTQTCAGGTLNVLLNNGDGTFPKHSIAVSAFKGGPVAVGDVNGDGRLDLVTGSGVLLGNGDGTFNALGPDIPSGALSIAVVDLNQDGFMDLVVVIPTGVAVELGNGDGSFQPAVTYKTGGYNPLSVVVADFNGDGIPDLAVANECNVLLTQGACSYNGTVGVLAGKGNGTFLAAVSFYTTGQYTTGIAAADVNSDTKIDLMVANACAPQFYFCTTGQVSVLVNDLDAATVTKIKSSVSPALVNQSVTFTATVTSSPVINDGSTITFYNNTNQIGTGTTVGGVATLTTSFPASGTQLIKAVFSGDLYHNSSQGTFNEVVSPYPTTTAIATSVNPSAYGQPVMLTATVTSSGGVIPTGNVTFKNGSTGIGTATLSGGVATLTKTNLPIGVLSITATYNGDPQNGKSTSVVLNQTQIQATTATSLVSALNPSKAGKNVMFTATVSSPTTIPTGSVTFMDGTTVLGTATLSAYASFAKATFSTAALASGSHNITAVYNGTANITSSASTILVQTVN